MNVTVRPESEFDNMYSQVAAPLHVLLPPLGNETLLHPTKADPVPALALRCPVEELPRETEHVDVHVPERAFPFLVPDQFTLPPPDPANVMVRFLSAAT